MLNQAIEYGESNVQLPVDVLTEECEPRFDFLRISDMHCALPYQLNSRGPVHPQCPRERQTLRGVPHSDGRSDTSRAAPAGSIQKTSAFRPRRHAPAASAFP